MKKKLDIGNITNELAGASLFFAKRETPPPTPETITKAPEIKDNPLADSPFFANETKPELIESASKTESVKEMPAAPERVQKKSKQQMEQKIKEQKQNESLQASNNASMHASMQSFNQETIIETIRKAVKDVGKDSATYRFTPEEKKALLELSFSFKMQGYKTSENELVRIAINFLLEDHRLNGKNSVLQRVLDALSQ